MSHPNSSNPAQNPVRASPYTHYSSTDPDKDVSGTVVCTYCAHYFGGASDGSKHIYIQICARQQNIIIPNNYGEKLAGTLHETGSVERVILCPGFRSTKDYSLFNVSGRYNLEKGIEERTGKDFSQQVRKDGYFDVRSRKGI